MRHNEAIYLLQRYRARWRAWYLFTLFVWSVAIAAPVYFLLYKTAGWPSYAGIAIVLVVYAVLITYNRAWRAGLGEVARYLDKSVPALEESTGLLLQEDQTGLLAQLQSAQVAARLKDAQLPTPWTEGLKKSVIALAAAAAIVLAMTFFSFHQTANDKETVTAVPEKKPEGVSSVTVRIQPPSYTGKRSRGQSQFNITAEEGSHVSWTVHTVHAAKQLYFILNDSLKTPLRPDASRHEWRLERNITRSGFYQLVVDSAASELYRLDMIADEPPSITVHRPKPNTVIDFGMPHSAQLQVTVSDDYGVSDAWIAATIASGSGEGVKFREETLRFPASLSAHARQYSLARTLDLAALKMAGGDELYFYIVAKDNAGHEKRSDIAIITIADTAQLMSLSGLQMGVNIKPDYFRSQRQIIIETEQLLRDKDTISAERFKEKSNNLGIDQKLLRMRYGKFLGEENELDGESHDDDHDAGAGDVTDFGNADKILDAFSHKHDIAEDAGFFSAETKAQLKATLAEMWNAELRLRTFQPQDALPFEYKALRLLKELQQKDRVYVAKTSTKTTPLKPEKRLTADLSKIQDPLWQKTLTIPDEQLTRLRNAAGELEAMKVSAAVSFTPALAEAYKYISNAAAQSPAAYLGALKSFKNLQESIKRSERAGQDDIRQVQQALQQLIRNETAKPYHPGTTLQQAGRDYFRQLQQRSRS